MSKNVTEKYGFEVGTRVVFIANSKPGTVSKVGSSFIYVKFDNRDGMKGRACYPQDLEME